MSHEPKSVPFHWERSLTRYLEVEEIRRSFFGVGRKDGADGHRLSSTPTRSNLDLVMRWNLSFISKKKNPPIRMIRDFSLIRSHRHVGIFDIPYILVQFRFLRKWR